jgi:hypothetical protein
VLRRQKSKRKKNITLPVDLTKSGEFPSKDDKPPQERMAECIDMATLVNDFERVDARNRARLIVKSCHEQRADNVLANMHHFLAQENHQLLVEYLPIGDNSPAIPAMQPNEQKQRKINRSKKTQVDLQPTTHKKLREMLWAFGQARKVAEGDGELKAVMRAVKNVRCGSRLNEGFGAGLVALTTGIVKSAAHGIVKSVAKNVGLNHATISHIARKTIKAFRAKNKTAKKKTIDTAMSLVQKKSEARPSRKTAPTPRVDKPVFQRPSTGRLRYSDSPKLAAWRTKWGGS